jgi:hypothetical protein
MIFFRLSKIFIASFSDFYDFLSVTRHNEKTLLKPDRLSMRISLTAAAKSLGVTREHLSRVLHGHRISKSLCRRFAALNAAQPKTEPTKP